MARYFLKLSFCGEKYNGWQSQPHLGTKCVQSTIEQALEVYLRQKIQITGCGRTDTGVHAIDYYAHFDFIGDLVKNSFLFRLNKILPGDIAIHDIIQVHDDAHARFDATSRSYHYFLHTIKSAFSPHSFYYIYGIPDLDRLNEVANELMKFNDFTTFCKVNTDVSTMICRIYESKWVKEKDQFIYKITADRFLRGMIRLIVGMTLNVTRGKLTLEEVKHALGQKMRTGHDWSVPADGLFLCNVKYPYL
ncbi:MAG: tRNA pseudouridine(38-40) synthase TruA [Saprospiraceae bacterium]|nr:tRNA pseudouridine(38-40) synthase TruA [Saprospiraceae bacterium]